MTEKKYQSIKTAPVRVPAIFKSVFESARDELKRPGGRVVISIGANTYELIYQAETESFTG